MWEWHTGDFSASLSSNNEYDECTAKVVLLDPSAYLYHSDSEVVCLVLREKDVFENHGKYLPCLFTVWHWTQINKIL